MQMIIAKIGSYQSQPPLLPWRGGSETSPQKGEGTGKFSRFQMQYPAVGGPRS